MKALITSLLVANLSFAIGLEGTYTAKPDSVNGAVACWLKTDVNNGAASAYNIVDLLDIKTGNQIKFKIKKESLSKRRTFSLVTSNGTKSCTTEGSFTFKSYTGDQYNINGKINFIVEKSTCKRYENHLTIHQLGNDTQSIEMSARPDFEFYRGAPFSFDGYREELIIQMPFGLNFSDSDHDSNCQNALCNCFFKFEKE